MPDLKPCPFDNYNCMCQFCEKQCNNGLNCSDCNFKEKIVHSVYLCTGFEGDIEAYIQHRKNRRAGEEDKHETD